MKLKSQFHKTDKATRLHRTDVPVIGLTGGIASGKSTVSRLLREKGFAVIDADKLVKDIYATQEALDFIRTNHPEAIQNDQIIFPVLREKVFKNASVKTQIEDFIYQRLPQAFMDALKKLSHPEFVIYDVPLLFEKKMASLFDVNVLVYAPRKVQKARLITRDGHEEALADKILDQQMDIEEKKIKAQFVIDNSRTETELAEGIKEFLRQYFE